MPVNESNTIQYTVTTTRITDGTVLYWKTTGNTTNSDIVGGNTGTITVTNNRAYINVTLAADETADGTKTLGITLLTGSLNGTAVATTDPNTPIVINDTSNAPLIPPTRLYSWGPNSLGQLGTNDTVYRSSPTQVGTETNWSHTGVGINFSFGVKTDGTLWAWGKNSDGQLGTNDRIYRSSPVQVGTNTNWSKVYGMTDEGGFAAAIKTDGTLWTWGGSNNLGTLGLNDVVNRSSPTQVGTGTDWASISLGKYVMGAIKTDNTLWTWGYNTFQTLGLNGGGNRSSPTQVAGTNWRSISVCDSHAAAIKTNGTLWLWGGGYYGSTGRGQQNDFVSSPVQIGSLTNWSNLATGRGRTLAIRTDGTIWTWGGDFGSQLTGFGQRSNQSSPTQIAGTTWSKVMTSPLSGVFGAIKTDGTIWLWGDNNNGQLGVNDRINRSSPIQVGTATNWANTTGYLATTVN